MISHTHSVAFGEFKASLLSKKSRDIVGIRPMAEGLEAIISGSSF